MEDYEKINALEWDLKKREELKQQAAEDGFQLVSSKKQQKQPKPAVKLLPPPPQAPSNKGGTNSQSARKQQRQPAKAPTRVATTSGRQQNGRQRRPPPRLAAGSENLGELEWRQRQPARAHIRIPIDLADQDKGHFSIAQNNNTFLLLDVPKGGRSGNNTAEFGIWGEAKAVQKTKEEIRAWIKEYESTSPSKSKGNPKFSKLCSLTPVLRQRAENKWEAEVKKHRFRQFPPPEKAFDAIGSFHWPAEVYKPEEILGSSYEALDPIRMDNKCYVVFNKEQSLFQIMGREESVKAGLMRIRGTYFQIVAHTIGALEINSLPDGDGYSGNVALKPYERIGIMAKEGGSGGGAMSRDESTEGGVACVPLAEDRGVRSNSLGHGIVQRSVLGTLKKLHYYRGSIQMRIRFGTFLATRYMKSPTGVYTIDEYKAMIQQSAFRGEVTQELGSKNVEMNILDTLKEAVHVLTPQDPMTHDLASIKPRLTATFTFVDPNNTELGDIRLTIIWEEHQDSNASLPTYEQVSKKWTRLDRDTGAPSTILATTLSEISTGMAWQFEINAAQSIEEERLPQGFAAYGDSIKPNPKQAQRVVMYKMDDMAFVHYRSTFTWLKSVEQRLNYRYNLKGSDYTLDLSRFQLRTFPPKKNLVSASGQPAMYEARWGLSVYRIEWDTLFTKNERLPVGEKADWEHEEKVWFPKDYDDDEGETGGFEMMMRKLAMIQELVEHRAS